MGMVQKTRSTFLNVRRWVILYVEIQNSWKSMSSRCFPSFHVKLVKLLVFGKAIGCPRCFSRCRLSEVSTVKTAKGNRGNYPQRSFVRPSRLDPTRIGGGSWVTCCCKTVHTLVRRIAILAESVQLCPMKSENSSSQIFLNCRPIVWMDDLAYAWVQWKNFAATHWLESTCLLLQPRNFVDRKFLLRHETACWISARTMVCIPK